LLDSKRQGQVQKMRLPQMFRNPWWVVFGAALGMLVGNTPITLFTFGLFLKPVTSEMGWGNSTFAAALFVSQLVGAISMPIVGRCLDKYGLRATTLLSIVIFSLATALMAQARSVTTFLLLYGICGLSGSGRGPVSFSKAISGWFQARRGLALGIAFSGLGVGSAIMPHVARLLIDHFGWRNAYVGLGIITAVISFPAVALFIRDPEQSGKDGASFVIGQSRQLPSATPSAREERLNSRVLWILLAVSFLASGSLTGIVTLIVPLLTDRGIPANLATWILSLAGIASTAGRLVSGHLLDRFLAIYVATSFFLLAIVGIVFLNATSPYAPALGGLCLGLGMGAETSVLVFLVGRYFRLRRFGEACGYVLAVGVLGNGAGPWLMTASYDLAHSYSIGLASFSLALVVSLVFIYRLGPYRYPSTQVLAESGP
jgi:MFS family permease